MNTDIETGTLDKRSWQRIYFSQSDFDRLFEQALIGGYLTSRNTKHDAIRDMIVESLLEPEDHNESMGE